MTLEEFKSILETSGLPVAYHSFPEGEAPPLPFICFISQGTNNFAADGRVYFSSNRIAVELYIKKRDREIEEKVKAALSLFFYNEEAEYLDNEKCWVIVYELEV